MNTRISAYLRTWPVFSDEKPNKNQYWNAGMIKGEYLTDVIIAFFHIDENDGYSIYIPEMRQIHDEKPLFSNLWDEVAALKKKFPHLKVNISIGGWGCEGFSKMAGDMSLRSSFVSGICDYLLNYNLDGVDIDWEFHEDQISEFLSKEGIADSKNYIILLQNIRDSLNNLSEKTGKKYSLSTTVPSGTRKSDMLKVSEIVNSMNLMCYNYYGYWSQTTGHHGNLYNNPHDPERGGWSTQQALRSYSAAGIPGEKINLGIGFFGRAFAGVEPGQANDGLYQKFKSIPSTPPFDEGAISGTDIEKLLLPNSGFTRFWDSQAKAPYLYNGDIWITYTDEEQIKNIAQFALEKRLGGIFVWEYAHDINAKLLKVLYDNAGRRNNR